MHESPTSQDSTEKPNSIQIIHKAISIFYMCDMIKYPYLNKWPFLAAFKTTTGECRDRWSKIANFQGEWKVPGMPLSANPISWSPSNMSQHCPQRKLDPNSESFRPRKSPMSLPLPVNCQKMISDGQLKITRFCRFSFWNHTVITYRCCEFYMRIKILSLRWCCATGSL